MLLVGQVLYIQLLFGGRDRIGGVNCGTEWLFNVSFIFC
jgi:hypothetical protein